MRWSAARRSTSSPSCASSTTRRGSSPTIPGREPRRVRTRWRAASRADDAYGDEMQRLMNKVSRVTIWVEPNQKQIVKYTFENVGLDFLPASWLVRVTELQRQHDDDRGLPERVAAETDRRARVVRARAWSVLGELRHSVLRLPRGRDRGKISRTRRTALADVRTTAALSRQRASSAALAARGAACPERSPGAGNRCRHPGARQHAHLH